jgi:hypothetical protein
MILRFETKEAAEIRNMVEAARRKCDMLTTRSWWAVVSGSDGLALDVGDGDGLTVDELAQCVDVLPRP